MRIFKSNSSGETTKCGGDLAHSLLNKKRLGLHATIIALQGNLGAGKTTFTQGFARSLGITRRLISPTFVIMRRYPIPAKNARYKKYPAFENLYHIDAYRLRNLDGLETLGLQTIFEDPKAIVLIEWPENIKALIPREAIRLKFEYGARENGRRITMSGV